MGSALFNLSAKLRIELGCVIVKPLVLSAKEIFFESEFEWWIPLFIAACKERSGENFDEEQADELECPSRRSQFCWRTADTQRICS